MANGEAPNSDSMEPIWLPGSAKPFGTQSEWPAFGMSAGAGAPQQSPAESPTCSNSSAASGESVLQLPGLVPHHLALLWDLNGCCVDLHC